MSEVVPEVQHEFWRPPVVRSQAVVLTTVAPLPEACSGCNTEFVTGSRFCYHCGTARSASDVSALPTVSHPAGFLRALSFQNVKQSLGLPLVPMIAFLVGLGCILAATLVGTLYTVETTLDFQAIQLWRIEWLAGAVAAFVAGILLKPSNSEK